jgi:hypothetical protein
MCDLQWSHFAWAAEFGLAEVYRRSRASDHSPPNDNWTPNLLTARSRTACGYRESSQHQSRLANTEVVDQEVLGAQTVRGRGEGAASDMRGAWVGHRRLSAGKSTPIEADGAIGRVLVAEAAARHRARRPKVAKLV